MCDTDISDYNNVIFVQNVYHYTVNIIIIIIIIMKVTKK